MINNRADLFASLKSSPMDRRVFKTFYDSIAPNAFSLSKIFTGSGQASTDIFKASFLSAAGYLNTFADLFSFDFYLYKDIAARAYALNPEAFKIAFEFDPRALPPFDVPFIPDWLHRDPANRKWAQDIFELLPPVNRAVLLFTQALYLTVDNVAFLLNVPSDTIVDLLKVSRQQYENAMGQQNLFSVQRATYAPVSYALYDYCTANAPADILETAWAEIADRLELPNTPVYTPPVPPYTYSAPSYEPPRQNMPASQPAAIYYSGQPDNAQSALAMENDSNETQK